MSVTELWWLSLAVFAAVVVVVAVLLGLIVATAKQVDRHAAEIWKVGKQIAGNTVSIWMLDQTNRRLTAIAGTLGAIEKRAESIDTALRRPSSPDQTR